MSSRIPWRSILSRGSPRSPVTNTAPTTTPTPTPATTDESETLMAEEDTTDAVSEPVSPVVEEHRKPPNNPRIQKQKKKPKFTGTLVKFLVGPEENTTEFEVHKEFVCYYSPVLDAAFNGGFQEEETKTYRIEDTTAGAFRYFLHWIYGQNLEPDEKSSISTKAHHLVRLWVLADFLVIPRLQNAVISKIHELSEQENVVFVRVLDYVYENTSDDTCPLRRYFVNELAFNYSGGFKEPELFPFELLLELARITTRVSPADLKPLSSFLIPVEED